MKIGLLTQTPSGNYGGILQAVALYKYLSGMGHQVYLFDKRFCMSPHKKIIKYLLGIIPGQDIRGIRSSESKRKTLKRFIDDVFLLRTRPIYTLKDFQDVVHTGEYDALIVGSDQVWRYSYIDDGHYSTFFLDVKTDRKLVKISYAASFGLDCWEAVNEVNKVSNLLKEFDYISTRENSGVEICKKTFGVNNALCVLDPTLLVDPGFYDQFYSSMMEASDQGCFVKYILDENSFKNHVLDMVIGWLNSSGAELTKFDLNEKDIDKISTVGEWLWKIKNARFVVTDSFHGMVFSIIFKRQFVVIGNGARGMSRFESLLDALGLQSRLIKDTRDLNGFNFEEIDYSDIDDRLTLLRLASETFIRGALS